MDPDHTVSGASGKADVHESDLSSSRAEIFRSKLIADFHLLDSVNEQGSQTEPPRYYTHDILDEDKMFKLIRNKPSGLVRFQVYHDKEQRQITIVDRRGNRVKARNSTWPPLDLYAHWIIQSAVFQNVILALILINSIVLGIQVEIKDSTNPVAQEIHLVLEIFDYCTLIVFVLEIMLKLLDDFWAFWKNRWNIFDFAVTFFSVVPEIVEMFATDGSSGGSTTSQLASVANNMRTFRVLRSLKMVSRFQKVRLIILAVTKAFQAMVFITVLLFIFAYIFAIIGVIFFDKYGTGEFDLRYDDSFSSIVNAIITLFQLFTLDHWRDVFDDVNKMSNSYFCFIYIFLWIIIGSFIFRNMLVGIMVNNFQGIRNELFEEVNELREREQRDIEMAEFARELERQTDMKKPSMTTEPIIHGSNSDSSAGDGQMAGISTLKELKAALSNHMYQSEQQCGEWQGIVERNLENLAKDEMCFCWPRDSLFTYFLMMEALQENLHEREELLHLAAEALTQIHDT